MLSLVVSAAEGGATFTVTLRLRVPPVPEQEIENCFETPSEPVENVPVVSGEPCHPGIPLDRVQEVA